MDNGPARSQQPGWAIFTSALKTSTSWLSVAHPNCNIVVLLQGHYQVNQRLPAHKHWDRKVSLAPPNRTNPGDANQTPYLAQQVQHSYLSQPLCPGVEAALLCCWFGFCCLRQCFLSPPRSFELTTYLKLALNAYLPAPISP